MATDTGIDRDFGLEDDLDREGFASDDFSDESDVARDPIEAITKEFLFEDEESWEDAEDVATDISGRVDVDASNLYHGIDDDDVDGGLTTDVNAGI